MATLLHIKHGLLFPFISFLLDKKKKEALQRSNTHIVTSAVKRTETQIFHTGINRVEEAL